MAEPIIDIDVSISSDSKTMVVSDDTQNWGDSSIEKVNITVVDINLYSDSAKTTLVVQITDNIVTGGSKTLVIEDDTELGTEQLPDGVYYYTISYTQDTGGGTNPLTKSDGVVYSTKIVEYNINDDLLDILQNSYTYKELVTFPKLEEVRRRSNILDAVNDAEFLSEIENVENLLSLLQRLE